MLAVNAQSIVYIAQRDALEANKRSALQYSEAAWERRPGLA